MTRRSSQRGFTLVEMMVVVVIVAILGYFVGGLASRTYGASPTSVADQIVGTLNVARTRALATRKIHQVQVHLELSPAEIWVYAAATPGMSLSNLTSTTMQPLTRLRIPASITLYSAVAGAKLTGAAVTATATEYDLNFLPDGSGTASTIYLTEKTQTKKARVVTFHASGSSYARQTW